MSKTTFINYWAPPLMIMLVALAGTLLFASGEYHTRPLKALYSTAFRAIPRNSESESPSSLPTLVAPENPDSDGSSLRNVADDDNTDDGISYLLAGLALISLLVPSLGNKFILASYALPKPSSFCCLPLERPG